MKNIKLTIVLLLVGIISINGQSDETKSKLKNIDGTITKITIETEDGNVEIEVDDSDGENVIVVKKTVDGKEIVEEYKGEGAEKFLKEHSKDGADDALQIVMEMDDDDFSWVSNDDKDCLTKKINVEIKNGEKTITVTTNKNGNEVVKIYTGDEADEFLKENSNGGKKMMFISETGGESTVHMTIDSDNLNWVSENCSDNVNKNVNVEINDGITKVTVTTTEGGEETVEVYEGDEAEKYLEEQDNMKRMNVFISEDGDSLKIMKKVIIIKETEDEDE